ncbi:Scaffold-type E3 ligase [Malassezia psittaci]|uniref:Defective in cullin neddylation protein n=1 Tax=Malassezia psittaci TaxID=1821823 RepID=A0AAF0FHK6_9BASI|nr:Scaffold-type E3 ligase [Malassezia psittaci]
MVTKASKTVSAQRFAAVTGASASDAQQYLRDTNYRLEAAIDLYFAQQTAGPRLSSAQEKQVVQSLERLFDDYRDPHAETDVIEAEGALQLFEDLQVDVASVTVLPLSYYLNAPSLGHFTKQGFVDGWMRLGIAPDLLGSPSKDKILQRMQQSIPEIFQAFQSNSPALPLLGKSAANSSEKGLYTTVYEYTFLFARSEGQKNLPLQVAVTFWDLLMPYAPSFDSNGQRPGNPSFTAHQFSLWKQYLSEVAHAQIVSKDTWSQFLEFTYEIDHQFKEHDFEAAWPSVIDEFVEWARKQIS